MGNKYKNFKEIPVWQESHNLTLEIYRVTRRFPREQIYGLVGQLRRSSASIPANITEGFYRNTTKELIQFLYNARGSAGETVYHLILAKDLKFISDKDYEILSESYQGIIKQLSGWIRSLKNKV